MYTSAAAAVAGAIGTVGGSAWQQAYQISNIAAGVVANDIAKSSVSQQILGDTLGLYNTIVAGVVGSVAEGASQASYSTILQAAQTLGTDIVNAAGNIQLSSDLTSLYNALAGSAAGNAAWQQAENASAQALTVVSNDETTGATSAKTNSDIAGLYDTIVSGSLDAIDGSTLQQAYENAGQTIVTLGSDIAGSASAVQVQTDIAGLYNSVVTAVAGGTATATAIEFYAATISGADTLAADIANLHSGDFVTDAAYIRVFADAATTPSQSIDWAADEAAARPDYIDQTDWNNIWTEFAIFCKSSG